MSYADTLLSTGERITHRDRQHWLVLVWGARIPIAAIIARPAAGHPRAANVSGTARDLLGLADRRPVHRRPRLPRLGHPALPQPGVRADQPAGASRSRASSTSGATDSSLEKINDAVLTQSIFGRMFGFGDLDVLTASEAGIERFRMIIDPIGFKRAMLDAKHEYEVDMERSGWQPSPPIRAAGGATATTSTGAGGAGASGPPARRRRPAAPRAATAAPAQPGPGAPPRRPGPGAQGQPRRGHPDAGQPRRPARPRRDLAPRSTRPRRRTCSRGSDRAGRPQIAGPGGGYHTRDPATGAAWTLIDSLPAAIVVAIMLLVGFPIHEFSHALAAYRLGDGTAKLFGRLTLNPIAHFDPVGGVAAGRHVHRLGGLGQRVRVRLGQADAGQPDEPAVRPARRGHRRRRRTALEPRPGRRRGHPAALPDREPGAARPGPACSSRSSSLFVLINLVLMVFNLIPIPPLDGSKVLFAFLDRRTAYQVRPILEQYGFFILILLFFLPPGNSIGGRVLLPIIDGFYSFLVGV